MTNAHPDYVVYEILNPLPVPIPFGIREPRAFTRSVDPVVFKEFLERMKPEIIHAHTIMGIHREFFQAARALNIRLIFTTHDYFGLCARTNFINEQQQLCNHPDPRKCAVCCVGAGLPVKLIRFTQSRIYQRIKYSWPMKRIRSWRRKTILTPKIIEPAVAKAISTENTNEYEYLYGYYKSIFEMIDQYHFNSRQSKDVYTRLLSVHGEVIFITRDGIRDHRDKKYVHNNNGILRIGYIGSRDLYKGIAILVGALRLLVEHGYHRWEAHLYGDDFVEFEDTSNRRIVSHGKYEWDQIESVLRNMDLLVVPSICKETFGLVVLEALSYGIPVLVSEHVGAKDVLNDAPLLARFKPCAEALYTTLNKILSRPEILIEYQRWITRKDFPFSINEHAKEMIQFYRRTIDA